MTKTEFVDYMKPILKGMGYCKTRNYWHRLHGDYIHCIYVQGSQWNKDNYYVEVGWAIPAEGKMKPTLTDWRYRGRIGGTNPTPQELLKFLNGNAASISDLKSLILYMCGTKCQSLGNTGQFNFYPV